MRITLFILFGLVLNAQAAPKSIGNPKAPKGGTFNMHMSADPETLNPISFSDYGGGLVTGFIFDTTLTQNIDTLEYQPGLAERWEVSSDKLTYTFYLRKDAVFSDGRPVTAEDIKFTYDAFFDPKYSAAHKRSSLSTLDKVEVVDPHTVRFKMKKAHFRNFEVLATYFVIAPKHIYDGAKNQKGRAAIGSGPYVLEKWDRNKSIILTRNPKWWGWSKPEWQGFFNFDKIHIRIIKEDATALASVSRGDLDFLELTAEQYVQKTSGGNWGKSVLKQEVQNDEPKAYGFFGWNLEREIFKDKRVRQSLVHLLNRRLMNEKFRFGKSDLATGPWYNKSEYADPSVKPFEFDPPRAQKLLAEAGWADSDKDGVLDKNINGKKVDLKFSMLSPNKDFEKYLTIYKEDLKKGGIDMNIVNIEWTSYLKKVKEKDFDVMIQAWTGGSNEIDPRQVWHSESANGGSNYISYKNPEVDKLIDQIGSEFDKSKRIKLTRKVYRIIADDAPYAFLFHTKYDFYAHSAKTKFVKPTFKYGVAPHTWWFEPVK